jgi:hypothetical protein
MQHRPSSLPMLDQCPCFESSGSDFAELGTDRHDALKSHYAGDDSLLSLLDDDSQEGIRWAADYIRAHSTDGHPLEWEVKREWTRPDFSDATGTPDVVNGPAIFDFKWRYRDYSAQMADYADSLIQNGHEKVTVHLLFGATRRAETLIFDADSSERIVLPILKSLEGNPKPRACDYCGWCARKAVCPAYVAQVRELKREGVTDIFSNAKVIKWIDAGCHTSALVEDAELVSLLLTWSRQFAKIHDGIEHFAKEAATKHGLKIPGYELKERAGRKYVTNAQRAFELSGLPAEKFLTACAVRLNTSKTNSDQIGLDKLFAESLGLKSATAKRECEKKLAEVIQRGKSTLALVSAKGGDEEAAE